MNRRGRSSRFFIGGLSRCRTRVTDEQLTNVTQPSNTNTGHRARRNIGRRNIIFADQSAKHCSGEPTWRINHNRCDHLARNDAIHL